LRIGLRYCKGLSERSLSSIVSERRRRPFSSVADLYRRSLVGRDSLAATLRSML
jgi:error-prone DNA polymerase